MDAVTLLFEPALLPFTIPLLFALVLWGLAALGLFDFDGFDADVDLDADADLDVEGAGSGLLQLLGVGAVPLSLVLTLLLFLFGFFGIALHGLLGDALAARSWSRWGMDVLFGPVALVGAVAGTALLARPLGGLFQDHGRAHGASSLVGKIAVLKSGTVSPAFGTAVVRVDGDLVEVSARSEGTENGLGYGDRVVIFDYDAEKNLYYVAPFEDDALFST